MTEMVLISVLAEYAEGIYCADYFGDRDRVSASTNDR